MAESIQSLDQLSQLKGAVTAPDAPKYEKKVDKFGRAYATGKRKDAVARVWIKPGSGKVTVNTRDIEVTTPENTRVVFTAAKVFDPDSVEGRTLRAVGIGTDDNESHV